MTKHESSIVNIMNICWCADPSHMLSIHLLEYCKWNLNITIAPTEGIFPCYGNCFSTTGKWLHSHGQFLKYVHD